ncbi:hypothetical protein BDZ89DRAFT_256767 [Hymenopellis radicata]|nr:hypothetical protein BDZ89DRAFT_256767 [Hymenopellis radicata]
MSTDTTLRQLLLILNDSVAALEERARSLGLPLPDLNSPFSPLQRHSVATQCALRLRAASLLPRFIWRRSSLHLKCLSITSLLGTSNLQPFKYAWSPMLRRFFVRPRGFLKKVFVH